MLALIALSMHCSVLHDEFGPSIAAASVWLSEFFSTSDNANLMSSSKAPQPPERRIARDGQPYDREQFDEYYKTKSQTYWNEARPETDQPSAHLNTGPLPDLTDNPSLFPGYSGVPQPASTSESMLSSIFENHRGNEPLYVPGMSYNAGRNTDEEANGRTIKKLDDAVATAFDATGHPQWHYPDDDRGNPRPKQNSPFDFANGNCTDCAKLDMYRGSARNDMCNNSWFAWYDKMTKTKEKMNFWMNGSETRRTKANRVEYIMGLAFACYTNGNYLPRDHHIVFKEKQEEAKMLWSRVWKVGMELGLKAEFYNKDKVITDSFKMDAAGNVLITIRSNEFGILGDQSQEALQMLTYSGALVQNRGDHGSSSNSQTQETGRSEISGGAAVRGDRCEGGKDRGNMQQDDTPLPQLPDNLPTMSKEYQQLPLGEPQSTLEQGQQQSFIAVQSSNAATEAIKDAISPLRTAMLLFKAPSPPPSQAPPPGTLPVIPEAAQPSDAAQPPDAILLPQNVLAIQQAESRRKQPRSLHKEARNALNDICYSPHENPVNLEDKFAWKEYVVGHIEKNKIIAEGITHAVAIHIIGTRDPNRGGAKRVDFCFRRLDGSWCRVHPGTKPKNDAQLIIENPKSDVAQMLEHAIYSLRAPTA